MTSYAWPDGSFSVSDHGLSSPSTPSSLSGQGTTPSETSAYSNQLTSWYGTKAMMQFNNGLGFPDYTLAYQSGMPSIPSRMSDITFTQQYTQSNMSHCPDPAQEYDSIPCPTGAELRSQLRTALSNCGLPQEEVERRIQNIDDPDGLDDITRAWWQRLDAELRSNSVLAPHYSGSSQLEHSPASPLSGMPHSDPEYATETSAMDWTPGPDTMGRLADDISGTASPYRAPSTAVGDTSASPAEVDWNSGLFKPTASESHDFQPDSESMSDRTEGRTWDEKFEEAWRGVL